MTLRYFNSLMSNIDEKIIDKINNFSLSILP